jgi:hypothetical protein
MTVDRDDPTDGDVLVAVAGLRACDVSERRSLRLRRRCHAVLQPSSGSESSAAMTSGTAFQRIIGPVLGAAWCLAYLVEIVRRAVAVYSGT